MTLRVKESRCIVVDGYARNVLTGCGVGKLDNYGKDPGSSYMQTM